MDGPERFEELIAFIEAHLGQPVHQTPAPDGSVTFTSGDPIEVHVRLSATRVTVFEHHVVWEGPTTPTARPRQVGSVSWRRLSDNAVMTVISALIKGARERRLASYAACQVCGQPTPPEWLLDDDVCQNCAEQDLSGVVH
ncbi:MAG: hypothetical protein ACM3SQ_00025 [Betaproteobacteria bacterium]